jgi:hypothetical protein
MGNCRPFRPLPSYDRRGALKPLPQESEHALEEEPTLVRVELNGICA